MDETNPTARALICLDLLRDHPGITAADPTDPVGAALATLVRALPEPVARQAELVRRTAAPARDRAAARPDPAIATALVDACAARYPVAEAATSGAPLSWGSHPARGMMAAGGPTPSPP